MGKIKYIIRQQETTPLIYRLRFNLLIIDLILILKYDAARFINYNLFLRLNVAIILKGNIVSKMNNETNIASH